MKKLVILLFSISVVMILAQDSMARGRGRIGGRAVEPDNSEEEAMPPESDRDSAGDLEGCDAHNADENKARECLRYLREQGEARRRREREERDRRALAERERRERERRESAEREREEDREDAEAESDDEDEDDDRRSRRRARRDRDDDEGEEDRPRRRRRRERSAERDDEPRRCSDIDDVRERIKCREEQLKREEEERREREREQALIDIQIKRCQVKALRWCKRHRRSCYREDLEEMYEECVDEYEN